MPGRQLLPGISQHLQGSWHMGDTVGEALGLGKDLQHRPLCGLDEDRHIVPTVGQPTGFQRPIPEDAEVAIGHCEMWAYLRRQKDDPAIAPFQAHRDVSGRGDLTAERQQFLLRQARLANPDGIGERVQQLIAVRFTDLLGLQQLLPAERRYCLMALDPSETGIAIAKISKTRDSDPFMGALALVIEGLLPRGRCRPLSGGVL